MTICTHIKCYDIIISLISNHLVRGREWKYCKPCAKIVKQREAINTRTVDIAFRFHRRITLVYASQVHSLIEMNNKIYSPSILHIYPNSQEAASQKCLCIFKEKIKCDNSTPTPTLVL
jgi:hypothetical protein